jgi:hypothetical protein
VVRALNGAGVSSRGASPGAARKMVWRPRSLGRVSDQTAASPSSARSPKPMLVETMKSEVMGERHAPYEATEATVMRAIARIMRQNEAMRLARTSTRAPALMIAILCCARVASADLAPSGGARSGPPLEHALEGACVVSPTEIWAAGDAGTIVRFDGRAWSTRPSGTTEQLHQVACAGGDVWIVGDGGTLLHGVGGTFTPVATGTKEHLRGVWAASERDIWVVGAALTILHWDGARWSSVPAPPRDAVAAMTAKQITIGRDPIPDMPIATDDLLGEPREPRREPPPPMLCAVWGAAADDVWAVGKHGLILHWDGARWSVADHDRPDSLFSVWGASARDVLAVGGGYRDPRGTVEGHAISRWDGKRWRMFPHEAVRGFDLVGGDRHDVLVGGGDGLLRVRDYRLKLVPGFEREDRQRFMAAAILGARDGVWLIGRSGEVLRWSRGRVTVVWLPSEQ